MKTTATTLAMLFEKSEDYTRTTAELLKLTTIDKSADVLSSLGARLAIVTNAIGLATGYLSKRVLFGTYLNPIMRVVGTLLQFIVSNVVIKEVNTSRLFTLKKQHYTTQKK